VYEHFFRGFMVSLYRSICALKVADNVFYASARIAPDTVLRLHFEGGLRCREIATSQAINLDSAVIHITH